MTAITMLDDATFVGAEHHHNLFTGGSHGSESVERCALPHRRSRSLPVAAVRRTLESGGEVRSFLEPVGEYHLGDMVNR